MFTEGISKQMWPQRGICFLSGKEISKKTEYSIGALNEQSTDQNKTQVLG